jgi:TonB family protein
MRRSILILVTLLFFAVGVFAQSGRTKASSGAIGTWPVPPAPVASPTPAGTLRLKPDLPKIVEGERIYTSKEVDQKVKILKKPTPGYSEEARRRKTSGSVIVRAILSADETVKHIEIVTGLPNGLSQRAIEAARQIKFKPAIKDGKTVSTWVELEYAFYVY